MTSCPIAPLRPYPTSHHSPQSPRLSLVPPCGSRPRHSPPSASALDWLPPLPHVPTSSAAAIIHRSPPLTRLLRFAVPPVSLEAPLEASGGAPEDDPWIQEVLESLKWDMSSGLVVAIAQNADTGAVMMQGFADRRAVAKTLATGRATFFSRSRKTLWTKGETSQNFIRVLDIFVDCDRDSLIYWGLPDGPTCHTGEVTCFFEKLRPQHDTQNVEGGALPLSTFYAVEHTIRKRQESMAQEEDNAGEAASTGQGASAGQGQEEQGSGRKRKPSWTQRLLSQPSLLCSKVREEADELCRTLEEEEGKERAASEMADLLYHALVLLRMQGVELEDVAAVLRSRFSQSGIEEKASRGISPLK